MEYSKVHGPKIKKKTIWDRNNLNYLHFPDADMNIIKTVCKALFQVILNAWWVFFFSGECQNWSKDSRHTATLPS